MKEFYRLFVHDCFGDDWSTNIDSATIQELQDLVKNPARRAERAKIIAEIGISNTATQWVIKKFVSN